MPMSADHPVVNEDEFACFDSLPLDKNGGQGADQIGQEQIKFVTLPKNLIRS